MEIFTSPRTAFWGGARHMLPITVAVAPFGLVYGISAAEIGLSTLAGVAMSILLFAGAAQFVTVELLRTETATWVIIGSIAIVNLRFVVYSASLAAYWGKLSVIWQAAVSHVITDEPYALSIAYFSEHPNAPHKHWYHLGNGLLLWLTWVVSSGIGLLVGTAIPNDWSLEFANSLMFIGLLVPLIKSRPLLVAGVVAGCVGLIAAPLPHNTGFVLAVICGIGVGLFLERRDQQKVASP